MPKDTRLIERWLPIAELGIESFRERTPMTPFPAPNRLHVWWARRPLIASRAAILASILPADADHKKFLHALGILGDPVGVNDRLDLPIEMERGWRRIPTVTTEHLRIRQTVKIKRGSDQVRQTLELSFSRPDSGRRQHSL